MLVTKILMPMFESVKNSIFFDENFQREMQSTFLSPKFVAENNLVDLKFAIAQWRHNLKPIESFSHK